MAAEASIYMKSLNNGLRLASRAGFLALLCLQGCATLPDAQREMSTQAAAVKFASAKGPVSEARGEAILDRLAARTGATDVLEKHLAFEQAVNDSSPLVLGNKLTLLQNGPDTYEAMFAAIRKAKDHINLETYIFDDGEAGRKFADLLLEKQAAGVQVNVIHDSVGTLLTPKTFFEHMRQGGINVLEFNPVNPLAGKKQGWRINNRDHRRQLVIDGRIAFTGGVNISDTYSSAPSASNRSDTTEGWRDTHVEMEGPVVAEFQKLFLDTWARQKGEPLAKRDYFPALQPRGDAIVRAIGSRYEDGKSQIYLTLISAITHAEQYVHLTVAYFGPDAQLRQALTDAAKRGVDVRLVLPSLTDSSPAFYLGRSYYAELLESGVKIYQRRGGVMHAKTACVDGVWSTVGSTNLDWRSFLHNDEMNAVILGRDFAAQMEKMFAADVGESQQITLEQWKRRPIMQRVKERLARIGAYWL
jgi:cardiolipin synthase